MTPASDRLLAGLLVIVGLLASGAAYLAFFRGACEYDCAKWDYVFWVGLATALACSSVAFVLFRRARRRERSMSQGAADPNDRDLRGS